MTTGPGQIVQKSAMLGLRPEQGPAPTQPLRTEGSTVLGARARSLEFATFNHAERVGSKPGLSDVVYILYYAAQILDVFKRFKRLRILL